MEKYFFGKTQHLGSQVLKFMLIGDDQRQKGVIELLKNTSKDFQSHISCVSGMQFLRKMLEYDYNPYADFFLKVFAEVSIKQLKKMGVSFHVCGTNKQLCKQDTLLLIYKYVKVNDLKPEFISFLLEDQETLTEFQQFKEAYQQKKEEGFQIIMDSAENLQKETNPIKSNSKEKLSILDQEPSIEQLKEIESNQSIIWKQVQEFDNHRIQHVQGQIVKTVHPLKCSLNRAIELLTTQKHKWVETMIVRQIIKQIENNKQIVAETYLWQDKQLFKKVVFFSEETLILNDDNFEIQMRPVFDYQSYEQYQKCDEKSQKLQVTYGVYKNNITTVTIIQNLFDKVQQLQYTPVLLKEVDYFEKTVQQLKLLQTE